MCVCVWGGGGQLPPTSTMQCLRVQQRTRARLAALGQVAWRGAGGQWTYPDKYVSSEAETYSHAEILAMATDRFVDHPQLPAMIKYEGLALQAVRRGIGGAWAWNG